MQKFENIFYIKDIKNISKMIDGERSEKDTLKLLFLKLRFKNPQRQYNFVHTMKKMDDDKTYKRLYILVLELMQEKDRNTKMKNRQIKELERINLGYLALLKNYENKFDNIK